MTPSILLLVLRAFNAAFRFLLAGRYASPIKAEDNGARTRPFIERKSPAPVVSAATVCNRVLYDYPSLPLNVFHSKFPVSKDAVYTGTALGKALRRGGPPRRYETRVISRGTNAVEIRRIYLPVEDPNLELNVSRRGSSLETFQNA